MKTQLSINPEKRKPLPADRLPDKLMIAGPCSAESPEQLISTACQLAQTGQVDYFRAGVWKPRTSPGTFQGMGQKALPWLTEAGRLSGLPVATEVGCHQHVEQALKHGIDLLWVGARTVSNPFVMQEIADCLQGVNIPVLVKNPLSPDLDLWEGAITRLIRAGLNQTGAIHRGFSWVKNSQFRNQPFWHIPLELQNRMPEIPVIADPSHLGGKRELVSMLALRAQQLGFKGFMIEVHPNPQQALSDATQQLTPSEFEKLAGLLANTLTDDNTQPEQILTEIRTEVDVIDEMLIWALSQRMQLADSIAGIKQKNSMEALQTARWLQVLDGVRKMGNELGLRQGFIEKLYNAIHLESISLQQKELRKECNGASKNKNPFNFVAQ